MKAKRVCRLCRERPATVPDREAGLRPIPAICTECHAGRLRGDMAAILTATQVVSDARLLELGMIDEYCERFTGKEFVVYDEDRMAYVESIDTFDGDTDYTGDPRHARIFRGVEWAKAWARKGRRFILPHNLPES